MMKVQKWSNIFLQTIFVTFLVQNEQIVSWERSLSLSIKVTWTQQNF